MQKTISILAVAGSIAFLGAGAAQAAEYPAAPVAGTVSDTAVAPGETVIFSGTGFTPGEQILISVDYTPAAPSSAAAAGGRVGAVRTGVIVLNEIVFTGSVTAAADGSFTAPIELKDEGTYVLTATGVESGNTVTSVVAVSEAFATPGGTTPGGTTPVGGNTPGGTVPGGTTPGGTTGGTTAGGTTAGVKGGLANTGIEASMFLWGAAGIGALGLGAGSIVVARRRAGAEA